MNSTRFVPIFLYVVLFMHCAGADCPNGFEPHGVSCYKAANLEASWAEAQMYCQLLGSTLAVIGSAAEETIAEGIVARLHGRADDTYWIAGTDIATEGNWRWMGRSGTSSPIIGYTNWPSGAVPSDSRNHNCLAIHYRHGKATWTDEYCSTLHSFICEVKLNQQETTTESATALLSTVDFT